MKVQTFKQLCYFSSLLNENHLLKEKNALASENSFLKQQTPFGKVSSPREAEEITKWIPFVKNDGKPLRHSQCH